MQSACCRTRAGAFNSAHSLPSLGLQGPSDENAFTPQRPTSNGNYGTPGGNAFATPASMASQHSIEDEETLLLDPQVTL